MEIIKRNTDYALRALVYLALHSGTVVNAGEIAASEDIPIDFLQKIMQKFVRSGLVNSHRGVQGGFSLAKEPRQVNVLEVVETMQGKLAMNRCFLGKDGCPRAPKCRIKNNWRDMEQKFVEFLNGITLQDLVNQLRGLDAKGG
ncbi:MAG: Rrf2 family transcriptional regulator [Firmicutes bacterium]|nr:Rrf2 family transcriptional regulator [Bacillota bacterium]